MSQSETPDYVEVELRLVASECRCAGCCRQRRAADELTRLRSALTAAQEREKAAEARCAELEDDLLRATSIGVATIIFISRCGAYGELTPYLKSKVDELQAMQAKCDAAFKRNQSAALAKEAK